MPSDGLVVVIPLYDVNIIEPDFDCDGIVDTLDEDMDGDGILNASDAFPLNPNESIDTDGDGIGNNADLDDDNDGYSDAEEIAFGSDSLDANSIPVVVSNDGFVVTPLVGTSSQVSFAIALKHKPESNVTIAYSSADETVAKPTVNTMTFTPDNWYRSQVVTVDILNPSSSTEIVFEPTLSSDSNYDNKMLEQVSIVSHQLLLYEPVDKVAYSEFNMSIPINMAYVGDNEENITVILDTAPGGMTLDNNNSRLLWNPPLTTEGQNSTVVVTVSDGSITNSITFELHVAQPTLLTTSIVDDKLVITDSNSSLDGSSIQALDGAVLSDYRLYKLSTTDTPAFTQGESVAGETLLIKGNIGKKVQVLLPLQGLVETDEILSFHTKSYFGSGNWRRVDYDYDFVGSLNEPVYVLNTEEFAGVVSFTKVVSGQQVQKSSKIVKSKQAKALSSGVTCSPKNFLDKEALNDQICTFDAKPEFTLRVFNYLTLQSNIDVEDIASWLMEAQVKLDDLSMLYMSNMTLVFEGFTDIYGKTVGSVQDLYLTDTGYGLFNDLRWIPAASIYLRTFNNLKDTKTTIVHEYFHHSQYVKMQGDWANENNWFTEATAVWFEDYVQNNSFDAYTYFYNNSQVYYKILDRGLIDNTHDVLDTNYANGLFFEMLEGHCSNFIDKFRDFFINSGNTDPNGFINFYNVSLGLNCNFGTPLGASMEQYLPTKLLYYQYATEIKRDTLLINSQAQQTLNFQNVSPIIGANDWSNIEKNVPLYAAWQDTTAQTIKVEGVNRQLSRCEEGYLHFKSEKAIMVSVASSDAMFPDTPTTMLGDMKQYSFNTINDAVQPHFRLGSSGYATSPEVYMTIIDPTENSGDTSSSQKVEMSYGIRRINLLSHIDGKAMCMSNVPQITEATVIAKGEIPSHYRDINIPTKYIDRIKMTNTESGNVFDAIVSSDGTWSTTINITFSGNESHFVIDGYNASTPQQIIASEGLVIVR
jgi:hypothetical protein